MPGHGALGFAGQLDRPRAHIRAAATGIRQVSQRQIPGTISITLPVEPYFEQHCGGHFQTPVYHHKHGFQGVPGKIIHAHHPIQNGFKLGIGHLLGDSSILEKYYSLIRVC